MKRQENPTEKKQQVGIWLGLQANIQPFEHPPVHPGMAMNTGVFRTVLRVRKRDCNSISSDVQEVSSMTGKDLLETYLKEEGRSCVHAHSCAREDCLLHVTI